MKMLSVSVLGKATEHLEKSCNSKNGQAGIREELEEPGGTMNYIGILLNNVGEKNSEITMSERKNNVDNTHAGNYRFSLATLVQSIRAWNSKYKGKCHRSY